KVSSDEILVAGSLKIDASRHKVTVDGKKIDLTPMEFKLLIKLTHAQGKVLSRDKLLDDIWDIAADVTTRTVDTHIKRLRQKLMGAGELIETVRGVGYRFNSEE
ncbi:winged helix-turn-helix domain-containing protein, partial [Thermodesulfobacteriota bacterium]